jgi:hypothetical protein
LPARITLRTASASGGVENAGAAHAVARYEVQFRRHAVQAAAPCELDGRLMQVVGADRSVEPADQHDLRHDLTFVDRLAPFARPRIGNSSSDSDTLSARVCAQHEVCRARLLRIASVCCCTTQ